MYITCYMPNTVVQTLQWTTAVTLKNRYKNPNRTDQTVLRMHFQIIKNSEDNERKSGIYL